MDINNISKFFCDFSRLSGRRTDGFQRVANLNGMPDSIGGDGANLGSLCFKNFI